ncbi:MAG: hypothetical protein RLZZ241_1036 [Bacteroidota bacterium]|jgi:LysM repeat protein
MGLKKTKQIIIFVAFITSISSGVLWGFQIESQPYKPIEFIEHKVSKKETLYGITRQYQITEKELKRYNPELYSGDLQRGMTLKIPRYATGHRPDQEDEVQWTVHVVKSGETRWSLAHQYGLTQDSLLVLNPKLLADPNVLHVGDTLKLPPLKSNLLSIGHVLPQGMHRVEAGETLYALSRQYKVEQEKLLQLNPDLGQPENLKEGMLIRVPVQEAQSNRMEYAFYEVRPKETQFALTKLFQVSWSTLLDLNPHLSAGLQAGMVLKIPIWQQGAYSVKNNLIAPDIHLIDSLTPGFRPKIAVLFPFRLDRLDLANDVQTLERIERNNALKYSLGLYSGLLVAMDSLAELGVSSEVHTFDTRLSSEHVGQILRRESWSDIDAVIGPLDSKLVQEVADFLEPQTVPVFAPVPIPETGGRSNLFATYTNEDRLRSHMLQYMRTEVGQQQLFVIADRANANIANKIVSLFPQCRIIPLQQEEENVYINTDALRELLLGASENWIFLETEDFKIASSVSSILNSINTEETKIRLFTTYKSKAFENEVISAVHLSNLGFTYPSANKRAENSGFTRRYTEKFGGLPDRYAERGFDLGMDVLLRLGYAADVFLAADQIGATRYTGNSFNYVKEANGGYSNTASYILKYDKLKIIELESL